MLHSFLISSSMFSLIFILYKWWVHYLYITYYFIDKPSELSMVSITCKSNSGKAQRILLRLPGKTPQLMLLGNEKPHRYRSGTISLRQITHHYQKLLICKLPSWCLVWDHSGYQNSKICYHWTRMGCLYGLFKDTSKLQSMVSKNSRLLKFYSVLPKIYNFIFITLSGSI